MTRKTLGRAFLAVGLSALGIAVWAWVRCARYIDSELHPPRKHPSDEARARATTLGFVDLTTTTQDNVVIASWRGASKNGATIVLVHGFGENREQLMPEAERLYSRGFGVLLIDLRACGDSGGSLFSWGDKERDDLRAALDGVSEKQIGVYGFSVGASVAALVAAHDHRVQALVLAGASTSLRASTVDELAHYGPIGRWAAFHTFEANGVQWTEVDTLSAMPALRDRSVLLVIGSEDPYVPRSMTDELFTASQGRASLLVVEGAGHGHYVEAPSGQEYLDRITRHFETNLELSAAGRPL